MAAQDQNLVKSKKRKRVGKKNSKQATRKIDITDVEEVLEEERFEQRTGGPASQKPESDLFFVDREQTPARSKVQRGGPGQQRVLRCHVGCTPDTTLIKPLQKANIPSTKLKGKPDVSRSTQVRRSSAVSMDIWSITGAVETAELDSHYAKICRKERIKPPPYHGKKPIEITPVEIPHPGVSYNPRYEDHQKILQKALEVELKRIKDEERVKRAMDEKFPIASDAPNEATWLAEMSAGLVADENEEKMAFTSEELSQISNNPPVRREDKKTEKERRKQKERIISQRELAKAKELKMRKHEELRLKTAKKLTLKREMELAARAARRELEKEKRKNDPKKLGKLKYEEPNIALKLTEELQGSLRLLKPEGHVLEDVFKSLQRRNIIETRTRAKALTKYRPKLYEKKTHKAVTI